jgi:hypothetical protein
MIKREDESDLIKQYPGKNLGHFTEVTIFFFKQNCLDFLEKLYPKLERSIIKGKRIGYS